MNTLFSSAPRPEKSWSDLTARARQAKPPGDLDVRCAVRAAIAAQTQTASPAPARGFLDDLISLSQSRIARAALGGCAIFAAASLWIGLDAVAGIDIAMEMQGVFLAAF